MSSDARKLFSGRLGKKKVAIYPKFVEVSIYVEECSKTMIPRYQTEPISFFIMIKSAQTIPRDCSTRKESGRA